MNQLKSRTKNIWCVNCLVGEKLLESINNHYLWMHILDGLHLSGDLNFIILPNLIDDLKLLLIITALSSKINLII